MNEILNYNSGRLAKREEITQDLFNRFIAYLDTSDKTIETYKTSLKQLFIYLQANGITRPQRADIIAYRDALKESGHKPTTIQNYITAAKLFFRWTAQEGFYPNITDHLKGARLDNAPKKDYLTSTQASEILNGIDRSTPQGKRDFAIFLLMVTGGLRDIEVARANIEDLRTAGNNTVLYIQGKGREEKTDYIIITAPVEKAIRDYLQTRPNADAAEPLFTSLSNNSQGGRLTTRSVSRIIKTAMRAAGYDNERLTAHSLRHTAVTLSFIGNEEATRVQEFARHSNINTTMIYNHSLEKAKNTCSQTITNMILQGLQTV
jgi:integrase/recombinase XerD